MGFTVPLLPLLRFGKQLLYLLMNSILAKLHSDPQRTNPSQWRVWYSTNGTTNVTQLGAAAVNGITSTASGSVNLAVITFTDANYADGNIFRVGDLVRLSCTGADAKFSTNEAPIVAVNPGVSVTIQCANSGSGTTGTLTLLAKVRKAIFSGFARTGQTANTGSYVVGPTFGSITLPITVASASTVTLEDPQGSSFILSDWSYKLGTINDTALVIYK